MQTNGKVFFAAVDREGERMNDLISRHAAVEAVAKYEMDIAQIDNPEASQDIDSWKKVYEYVLKTIPAADAVAVDKVQKEIDYWHDKAQSYEQTILKLALNKADVVEVVRCKDCKHYNPADHCYLQGAGENDYCSYGERGTS